MERRDGFIQIALGKKYDMDVHDQDYRGGNLLNDHKRMKSHEYIDRSCEKGHEHA